MSTLLHLPFSTFLFLFTYVVGSHVHVRQCQLLTACKYFHQQFNSLLAKQEFYFPILYQIQVGGREVEKQWKIARHHISPQKLHERNYLRDEWVYYFSHSMDFEFRKQKNFPLFDWTQYGHFWLRIPLFTLSICLETKEILLCALWLPPEGTHRIFSLVISLHVNVTGQLSKDETLKIFFDRYESMICVLIGFNILIYNLEGYLCSQWSIQEKEAEDLGKCLGMRSSNSEVYIWSHQCLEIFDQRSGKLLSKLKSSSYQGSLWELFTRMKHLLVFYENKTRKLEIIDRYSKKFLYTVRVPKSVINKKTMIDNIFFDSPSRFFLFRYCNQTEMGAVLAAIEWNTK